MKKLKLRRYVIIVVIAILLIFAFINAGKFLVVNQSPQKADVIVVLAGDSGERTEYGVKLLKEDYANKIIFSGGLLYYKTTAAELMKEHALDLGVLNDSIILEDKADSTLQNAIYSKDLIKKEDFSSAIIVTSNYHMRRTKMVFDKEFKDSGIQLTYCAAEDKNFNADKWWANNKSIIIVINEYVKLIGYWMGKGV